MDQEFRGILLKFQDRLSDNDRKRLHFFFGNDVPRRIRDDPTLGGTLSLLESLFDQDKINEQDYTLLINALEQICCLDAAKLLKDYMKQTQAQAQPNGQKPTLERLSSLMPSGTMNELFDDLEEEDRCAIKFDQMLDCKQTTTKQPIITRKIENKEMSYTQSKRSRFFINIPIFQICLMFSVIFLFITSIIFISLFIQRTNLISTLEKELYQTNHIHIEKQNETNETMQSLKARIDILEKEKNNSPIRIGTRYCGVGGGYFDDSLLSNFTLSHRIRGMSNQRQFAGSNWFQFHYSSIDRSSPILQSNVHGTKKYDDESDLSEQFYLDKDDTVSKIQVFCQKVAILVGSKERSISSVRGIRLFTKKGRKSAPIDTNDGELHTEEFDGYYAAYATGKYGIYLDQVQFYWTRASTN